MTSRELVEIIEAELKRKGTSKGDFYKACGISSGHMSNWRRELNYPQTPTLIRISDYLGINLMGSQTKPPATEGDGRYGLSPAEWKQIGHCFGSKLAEITKAPAYLATDKTGLSEDDVEAFIRGERYVTKAQIHAMAECMGMELDYIIKGYAQFFEGEEDEKIAKREEINRLLDAAPEWLQDQIHSLLKAEESGRTSQGGDPKVP